MAFINYSAPVSICIVALIATMASSVSAQQNGTNTTVPCANSNDTNCGSGSPSKQLAPLDKVTCTANSDCSKYSQSACPLWSNAMSPPCKKSQCGCQDCYVNVNNQCLSKRYINSIGASCNGTAEEVITVPWAYCFNGTVVCPKNTDETSGSRCYAGLTCESKSATNGCPTGMQCNSDKKCVCSLKGHKFDSDRQACLPRNYNDDCKSNDECSVAGFGRSGAAIGYARGSTGVCTAGKCYCGVGYKAATIGVMDALTRVFIAKTVCVPDSASIDLTNGTCHLDPINAVPSENNTVQVCKSSYICYRCSDDTVGDANSVGTCRLVNTAGYLDEIDCMVGGAEAVRNTFSAVTYAVVLSIITRLFTSTM